MNKNLPIYDYIETIVDSIFDNDIVIVKAETGSGKSTQIPQALFEYGYEVIVTQPRRIAAWSVAKRVANELGCELGTTVGFRTGFEHLDSVDTKILFCTDGLEFARRLMTKTDSNNRVLCIDEVHEWNLNIEALVAWCKKQIGNGLASKVVIMSATIDTEKLQKYFDDCPVIEVPGNLYPVKMKEISEYELLKELEYLTEMEKNILVFLPGKTEINQFIERYEDLKEKAIFLPLHGELSVEEQSLCFDSYEKSKIIVATNIAQTSITIPDIDVVIDFGTEKRIEIVDGVEGLYLRNISQADCIQRKGRAGRVKNGLYYLVSNTPFSNRETYTVPEIQRLRFEGIILKFLSIGVDIEELKLFHEVSLNKIRDSKELLENLGAIKDGKITEIGIEMSKMPLKVELSRMLIEAEKRGVLRDCITISAILQVGLLYKKGAAIPTKYSDSDIVNYLYNFKAIEEEYFKNHNYDSVLFENVNKKNYKKIVEIRAKILEYYSRAGKFVTSTSNPRDIIASFLIGHKSNIYIKGWGNIYNTSLGDRRQLDKASVCNSSDIVVAIKKDIQIKDRWGYMITLNLLTWCSKITTDMIEEVVPELITREHIEYYYDDFEDVLKVRESVYIDGRYVFEEKRVVSGNIDVDLYISKLLANATCRYYYIYNDLYEICKENRNFFNTIYEAEEFYISKLRGVKSMKEILENKKMLNSIRINDIKKAV